jgi:hypothetical protein
LAKSGIVFESSVMPGAYSADSLRPYDYRSAPRKALWRFESDPLREAPNGHFVEVPITVLTVGPLFFWRYLLARKLAVASHRSFGDGDSIRAGTGSYLKKLLAPAQQIELSVDGFKSSLLPRKWRSAARPARLLNIMGHPKALSAYSLARLDEFLARNRFSPAGFNHDLLDLM